MAPKPPASLVRYLRDKRCVLFCGSGLSAWAKLPTWKNLLENIVRQLGEEMPDDPNLAELDRLLAAGKLLEVADHSKEALGRRYNDILSEHLRGATGPIPEPHNIIVQLPFSAIVTTNYDKLLERSYASVTGLPKTPTHQDVEMLGPLLFDGSFFILKAHGDIDRPESMVLTTRDYQNIIHSNPAFNSIFSAILLTKAVLFIGYSLNDPDFRLLLDRQLTIFRGNIPDRYALMSGVGKVESEVLWRTARIRVLPYEEGKHEQVLDFLKTLLAQVTSQPAADSNPLEQIRVPAIAQPTLDVLPKSAYAMSVLSLRLRGQAFEASITSGDDTVQGSNTSADWPSLVHLVRDALEHEAKARLLGQQLANRLPEGVRQVLENVPRDHLVTLRLSPDLELLPWEWTLVQGEYLVLRNPIVRAPRLSDTARGYPTVRQPPRILLIGDPNRDDSSSMHLPGAQAEVEAIATVYGQRPDIICKLLLGAAASFENVAAELSRGHHDVVHFAGHAWFDELESFLFLSGPVKLSANEMRSLLNSQPPAILFLNSHFTIFAPPGAGRTGSEPMASDHQKPIIQGQRGFMDAASTAGVGSLVGSFSGGLDDTAAEHVGVQFHKALLEGACVAKALHNGVVSASRLGSLVELPKGTKWTPAHLSYTVSGYGDIMLPPGAPKP